jgi:glycerol-3-phosphate dehydrogenase
MHRIEETSPGVISVLGGKITGYRAIAEEAATRACLLLGVKASSSTAEHPLPGGGKAPGTEMGRIYGSRAGAVESLAAVHGELAAQVLIALREEYCRHLDDFLLRRTPNAFAADMGSGLAEEVLRIMAGEMQWDGTRLAGERLRYRKALERAKSAVSVYPPAL